MLKNSKQSYHKLPNTFLPEEKLDSTTTHPKSTALYRRPAIIITTAILSFIVIFLTITSLTLLRPSAPPPPACGTNSTEALAHGCKFNQLMWAWHPPSCPTYANTAFLNADTLPWRFWTDPWSRTVANESDWPDILDNKVTVYGERREHLTHCVYMFLSLGEIIRTGGRFTERQVDEGHLSHCGKFLMSTLKEGTGDKWWEVQTKAPRVGYGESC